jgi:hypothetical protein
VIRSTRFSISAFILVIRISAYGHHKEQKKTQKSQIYLIFVSSFVLCDDSISHPLNLSSSPCVDAIHSRAGREENPAKRRA